MSFRLEMLQVARLAPGVLGSAAELVTAFLRRTRTKEGAWPDREGRPDLYYTVFGVEGLLALRVEEDHAVLAEWLRGHGDGEGLDFVHLCCLARCWAALPAVFRPEAGVKEGMAARLEAWRTPDGGFHQRAGSGRCTAYGCLLGWAALGDLGFVPAGAEAIAGCLESLKAVDGGYANEPGLPFGTTTATAAAVSLHRLLRRTPPVELGAWLLGQRHPGGGFKAFPGAPIPDLLSTAVALHALDGLQCSFAADRDALLDFTDSLWSADGGFHGNWTDDALDVEYTYYGLLALGHLAF